LVFAGLHCLAPGVLDALKILKPETDASATAATSRARSIASTKAGVIAFARTGDPHIGQFADAVVVFKAGEVPDDVFDVE
jgi:hypothetical protein